MTWEYGQPRCISGVGCSEKKRNPKDSFASTLCSSLQRGFPSSQVAPPVHSPSLSHLVPLTTTPDMSFDANTAGNAEEIEMQFAVKTVEHLEASLTLLSISNLFSLTLLTPGLRETDHRLRAN